MVKTIFAILFVGLLFFGGVAIMWRLQNDENLRWASSPQPVRFIKPSPTLAHAKKERTVEIPAFQIGASVANLPPTLSAEMFTGSVRAAYTIAGEIPETLAQIPCYCKCDRSLGHKSLHSCFADDHASKCGTCMNEAYRLKKEQKLNPEQIREKIIAEYSPGS